MKKLKNILIEGLADWDEGDFEKSIKKETSKTAIKKHITDWIVSNNLHRTYKNRITINTDSIPWVVDYRGAFNLSYNSEALTNGLFEWGTVDGDFKCIGPKITSFAGGPKKILGDLILGGNIISIDNEIEYVSGSFRWGYSDTKSLKGCPKYVGKRFFCCDCPKLETLEGAPETVKGDFYCSNCINLKSLKGAPEEVGATFDCYGCKSLKDLTGAPKRVGWDFSCLNCINLKSLKGAPEYVHFDFNCSGTSIKTLEGGPEEARAHYICVGCKNLESLKGLGKTQILNVGECKSLKDVKDLYGKNIPQVRCFDGLPAEEDIRKYLESR